MKPAIFGGNTPPLPAGVSIRVYVSGTVTLATIYDFDSGLAIDQTGLPFIADADGRFAFTTDPGQMVDVQMGGEGNTADLLFNGGAARWFKAFPMVDPTGSHAGDISFHAASSPPSGWLKANGAAVSRATYAALFAAIGATFGVGDGSTTFNLPDLRGEFLRGWDDGRGVDSGRVFGSAQSQSIQSHNHLIPVTGSTDGTDPRFSFLANDGTAVLTTGLTGSTETRPRNIALLACIKY